MKKILPFAALLLAAAGSWAFYPKAEAAGTTMVIGRIIFAGSSVASLAVIEADGTVSEVPLEVKGGKSGIHETLNELHKVELAKVNQLQANGYRLISTTSTGVQATSSPQREVLETIYYLNR